MITNAILEEMTQEVSKLQRRGAVITNADSVQMLVQTIRTCANNAEEEASKLHRMASMLSEERALQAMSEHMMSLSRQKRQEVEAFEALNQKLKQLLMR